MATVWDEAQVRLYIGSASRPDIHIYSAAGRQLGLVLWERGSVLAAGWSSAEELLVVEEEGTVRGQERVACVILGAGRGAFKRCMEWVWEDQARQVRQHHGSIHRHDVPWICGGPAAWPRSR